jgi:hypothetical protein
MREGVREPVNQMKVPSMWVWKLAFAKGGDEIISASQNREVTVCPFSFVSMLIRLCTRLSHISIATDSVLMLICMRRCGIGERILQLSLSWVIEHLSFQLKRIPTKQALK